MMKDQAEKLRQMVQGNMQPPAFQQSAVIKQPVIAKTRVIAVTSGKGGVGKTNFTVNLAIALASLGQKVLVVDADLGMANVDVILGHSPPHSMMSLLEGGIGLKDVVSNGPLGIKFMSGGSGIYQLADLNDEQLQYIISQITQVDDWANITLIDTGAGINRNVLRFVMAADEVIIITTPEPTAITDAYAMMKAYSGHHGTAPLRLIVNRVLEIDEGQLVVDKLIKVAFRFLGLPINNWGFIYEDHNMLKAVKNQNPLLLSFPDSISARCIEHIAHRVLYGEDIPQPKGFKGFFQKFLQMW